MGFTTNRNIETPAHNADINTWDVNVNSNSTIIDYSLGGVTQINVTAGSGTVVLSNNTASPPSYICPTFELAGTLSANIDYQFPSGVGGNYTVFNGTTGAFAITFSVNGGGSLVIPQGASMLITVDGTNVLPVSVRGGPAYNSWNSAASATGLSFNTAAAAVGFVEYQVVVSFKGLYANSNGTAVTPSATITLQDGVSGATIGTPRVVTYTVPSGYSGYITHSVSQRVVQPVNNAVNAVVADTQGDGGSHSWTDNQLIISISGD